MVARIVTDPESILTDPTAPFDLDNPEIRRMVEEKPWLKWEKPEPIINAKLYTRTQKGVADNSILIDFSNGKVDNSFVVACRMEGAGQFDEGMEIHVPKFISNLKDLDRALQPIGRCVSDQFKSLIENNAPGCAHFRPTTLASKKTGEVRSVWVMFTKTVLDCLHERSPAFVVMYSPHIKDSTPSMNTGKRYEFFRFDKIKNFPLFRSIGDQGNRLLVNLGLAKILRKGDTKFYFTEEGYAFPDGTAWHPILLPQWPPQPMPMPLDMSANDRIGLIAAKWRHHPLNTETRAFQGLKVLRGEKK